MIQAMNEVMLAISSSLAASIVAKVTVITALALFAAWLARRSPASVRHALLAAAFGVTLLLPIASVLAPPVHLGVPVAVENRASALPPPVSGGEQNPHILITDDLDARVTSIPQLSRISLSHLLIAGWIAGGAIFLLPMAIGLWQIRLLRRSGLPWRRGQSLADTIALDAGLHRRVEVLLHEGVPGPMACGIVHTAIVLPRDAESWNEEDLNRAFMHELEHVRRYDSVSHCLARGACAVYWFHPLVWVAWRRLALEAERSCDDAVLRCSEATAYADQLVGLAKRLSAAQRSPLLAMANRADLTARVRAVLDTRQRRGRAGAFSLGLTTAAALVLVFLMSSLILVATPQAAPTQTVTPSQVDGVSVKPVDPKGQGEPSHSKSDPQRLTFEVASVRLDEHAPRLPGGAGLPPVLTGGRFEYTATVHSLIVRAYGLRGCHNDDCDFVVGGPSWIKDDMYRIEAKLPEGTPAYNFTDFGSGQAEGVYQMIQSLLVDRFGLKVHREAREIPVYALTVGPGGHKLTPNAGKMMQYSDGTTRLDHRLGMMPIGSPGPDGVQMVSMTVTDFTLQEFAENFLSNQFDRPVLDRTGVSGRFDFSMEFDADPPAPGRVIPQIGGPGLMTGLSQQLGLRLQATKAPVDELVIDGIQRPTDN